MLLNTLNTFNKLLSSAGIWSIRIFDWWCHELLNSLPRTIRQKLPIRQLKTHKLKSSVNINANEKIQLVVPKDYYLVRPIRLPSVSNRKLISATRLKLETISPLPLSDIYWGWRLKEKRKDSMLIEIFIARKSDLNAAFKKILTRHGKLLRAFPEGQANAIFHCNTIEYARLNRLIPSFVQIAIVLLIFFVSIFIVSFRLDAMIAKQETLASDLHESSIVVAETRQELEDLNTAIRLIQEKMQIPDPLFILSELNKALPNTVWLQELRINGRQVTLAGEAENASEAALALSALDVFENIRLQSMTPENQKERFNLTMDIVQ